VEASRQALAPDPSVDPIAEARRQWVHHWGEQPAPSMSAVTAVMRVQQILMTRLNVLLKPFGLTFPRYEALMILRLSRRGALPLGKVGARLQVHPTSVTNLVDGLERAGLVRREPHEQDRRATLAIITERGRAVADAATAVLNGERFGTAPLADGELETISRILRGLRADEDGFDPLAELPA
jgi:DNA-binding MarR family transcriptional regulator